MRIDWIVFALSFVWIVLDGANLLPASSVTKKQPSLWRTEFSEAWTEARELQRPLVIHFYANRCAPCRRMERDVLDSRKILQQLETSFVGVKIDCERHPVLVRKFRVASLPSDVVLDPEGRILSRTTGYQNTSRYLARLGRVEVRFAQSRKFKVTMDDKFSSAEKSNPREHDVAVVQGGNTRKLNDQDSSSASVPLKQLQGPNQVKLSVGLDAFSPVSLSKLRTWRKGKKQLAATYQGIVYYMATIAELREFEGDAPQFVPRLQGCDPVVMWNSDCAVPGSTQFCAFFDNQLFLFVSAESRERFKKNPLRYTRTRHVLQVDQIERTRQR